MRDCGGDVETCITNTDVALKVVGLEEQGLKTAHTGCLQSRRGGKKRNEPAIGMARIMCAN